MKIPSKVKIGAYDYKVEWVKELKDEKAKLWGLCDRENHIIFLDKGLRGRRRIEVFLHECLHGMEESYDIELGEKKVSVLGLALLAFFVDNKLEIPFDRRDKTKTR